LETFPLSGRRVPEFPHRLDLRELFFEQFRIVYKLADERVDILTVRHTLQLTDETDPGE
jgi:plasmid stabilization system protein ParE